MIILHFHLPPQFAYELFHMYTSRYVNSIDQIIPHIHGLTIYNPVFTTFQQRHTSLLAHTTKPSLLRNRKKCTVVLSSQRNPSGSLGDREMNAKEIRFRVLLNFLECFYDSIETRRTCFYIFQKTLRGKKRKQLVYFDHQNVNSLCSLDYVNSSCQFSVSIELQKHDFQPINARFVSIPSILFIHAI